MEQIEWTVSLQKGSLAAPSMADELLGWMASRIIEEPGDKPKLDNCYYLLPAAIKNEPAMRNYFFFNCGEVIDEFDRRNAGGIDGLQ